MFPDKDRADYACQQHGNDTGSARYGKKLLLLCSLCGNSQHNMTRSIRHQSTRC